MKKTLFIIKLFVFCFACFLLILSGFYAYAYITPNTNIKVRNKIEMYDNNSVLFYDSANNSDWVKLSNISENVINSTISVEDKNFYSHQGFDYLRILKAIYINIKSKSLNQGASTISQQYIKNLYLDFDKTWKRKFEEAFLTFELEVHNSKDEILEGYLNTINYGAGNYGIENASNYYFNKSSNDLSLAEAALLVGIPKNPSLYNPITNYGNAKERQKIVLKSMVNNNYISEKDMNEIYDEKLIFYGKRDNQKLESVNYYKDSVISELKTIEKIPKSLIESGGLKIYTNLDLTAQEKLENIISEELEISPNIQVGSLVLEPKTGKVIAIVGGRNYNKSQFNRVSQAKRQVGSTIKPILYYAALENGFTPSSTFLSEKSTFNLGNETYSPQNYGGKYANGKISMAAAIAYSDNIYAVKTHLFLGENVLVDTAKRMGISSELKNNASLALGTNEISMLDYSNAFSTLANEGVKNKSYLISKVTDLNNNILYEYYYKEELVLNSKIVYILNEMMANTYKYDYISYVSPTMLSIANLLTKKYAVKSGSTQSDYWTVGYNSDALVMVWNGYDDNLELSALESKANKRIWARTIESILEYKDDNWYDIPDGVVSNTVDFINGTFESNEKSSVLFYLKGTEPILKNNIFNPIF